VVFFFFKCFSYSILYIVGTCRYFMLKISIFHFIVLIKRKLMCDVMGFYIFAF
jgi:hypothetical protein